MPLPTFDSLDAVPESFREYARETDGKFTLDLVPGAEVVGLRSKAQQLLDEKKALAARFDGVDPDEYKALKASGRSAKDLDDRLKAAAAEKAALEAKLSDLSTKYRTGKKSEEVTRALAAENAVVELLGPIVSQMVDVDDDGHVVVRAADGGIRYRDGAGNRMTVSDLLSELKTNEAYQPAFRVKVGSGGNASQGGAPQGIRLIDPSDRRSVAAYAGDIATGKARIAG